MLSSSDPTYPLFPILSFLGFVVSFLPLPWHLQAWNSGTCAYMVWTGTGCLILFINSLVWAGNISNPAPIWCDISSKIILGAGIAIPASILCISRRLYTIASSTTVSMTRRDKRNAVLVDLAIAVGIPVIVMALHVVVQGHRYDIIEDFGCFAVVYHTLPAYFLVYCWPTVLGCVSFVYSALTLRAFWKRRLQFAQVSSANSALNFSRYLRLMLLACIDMLVTVPMGVASVVIGNAGVPLAPWISWEETHFDFARVAFYPAFFWRNAKFFSMGIELTRWLFPVSAFVFFALFGFASEARKNYAKAFWFAMKPFGIKPHPATPNKALSLPSWSQELPAAKANRSAPRAGPPAYSSDMSSSLANDTVYTVSLGPMSPSDFSDSMTCVPLTPTNEKDEKNFKDDESNPSQSPFSLRFSSPC
ncbi:pheromone A receptor-domain-containing protein [Coprinopsis sp. MPI-PUGE-AT-0042]|nr:pheromone A receptor-domain-containing protein [Coprinopsis sp. MPI-PUGE-AT-0042]